MFGHVSHMIVHEVQDKIKMTLQQHSNSIAELTEADKGILGVYILNNIHHIQIGLGRYI